MLLEANRAFAEKLAKDMTEEFGIPFNAVPHADSRMGWAVEPVCLTESKRKKGEE